MARMKQVPLDDKLASSLMDPEHVARLLEELSGASAKLGAGWADEPAGSGDALPQATTCFIDALSRAQIGIVHRSIDGRIIAVNDFFCELIGRSKEDIGHLRIEDHSHPDDVRALYDIYTRQAAKAAPFRTERRYIRSDGSERWCQVHVTFLGDQDGRPTSTVAVVLDDTTRRQAEAKLRESETHYRNSVELAAQISWTAAPDGAILEVSPRWADVTGTGSQDALGHGWLRALHEDDLGPTQAIWEAHLASAVPLDVEYRLRTAAGGDRWFRSRAAPRLGPSGEVIRWYGALEDIDDRKRAEQALRESEERFRLAAQSAGLGIWDYDAVAQRREWSDDFKTMLGLPLDAEPLLSTALELVAPEDRHLLQGIIQAVDEGDRDHRFEALMRVRRADDGAERWMQTVGWRIEGACGNLDRVLVTIMDVTEQRNAEERIRWTANHDALTGLPNRGYFNERLDAAIQRAGDNGARLALILLDIDNLKETNDTIGHDAGDELLRSFARRLEDRLGGRAFLARLGGDEFAVFLEVEAGDVVGDLLAGCLRDDVTQINRAGLDLICHATAGSAEFPRDGKTAEELLKTADIALYAGKAGQRGAVSVFEPEMRAHVQRRASMLAMSRKVIADRRIVPHYQPKVTLADGRVVGFEALLRWRHDFRGIQGPAHIAGAFEDLALASAIGEQMLDAVCGDVREWLDRDLAFGRIAINLSPAEFRSAGLFDRIMERLHRSSIPPRCMELEVTETVFLGRGTEHVVDMLTNFHKEGLSLALDDFGTGYASLTHLQAFPVDVIKMDRSFVSNLAAGSANAAIVDAIIGLAARLGIEVIAEGIEAREEAAYLLDRGCAYGQGFLFSPAVPADRVPAMLGRRGKLPS